MKRFSPEVCGIVRSRGALTTLVALIALGLSAAPAVAQQGQGGRRMMNADERLAQLTEQLDLTDDQAKQMKPIIDEQTKKQQEIFDNSGGDRETMRAEMTKLWEETQASYAEVLTEEQMKQYQEMMQRRMRQRPPPAGGR